MNLANEQPFSHKSNAGQVGNKWGDVLPRKALLVSSHTALGCAFQFPLFRHLTRAVKEWEAWGRKQCWTQKLGKGTWCLTGGQSHPWYAPKHYKMLSCEQADIQLMKNGVFCLFPGSSELQSQGQSGLWPRKTSLLSGQKEVSGSVTQTQMLGDPAEVCHSFLQLCVAVKGLSEVPVWEKHPFFLNGSVPSRGVIW